MLLEGSECKLKLNIERNLGRHGKKCMALKTWPRRMSC